MYFYSNRITSAEKRIYIYVMCCCRVRQKTREGNAMQDKRGIHRVGKEMGKFLSVSGAIYKVGDYIHDIYLFMLVTHTFSSCRKYI